MIDYNRSSNRKGFDFDLLIPKFGIDYDRNKQQKRCVLFCIPGHILTEFFAKNSTGELGYDGLDGTRKIGPSYAKSVVYI